MSEKPRFDNVVALNKKHPVRPEDTDVVVEFAYLTVVDVEVDETSTTIAPTILLYPETGQFVIVIVSPIFTP